MPRVFDLRGKPRHPELRVMAKTEFAAWLATTMGKFDEKGIGGQGGKEIRKDQVLFQRV